MYGAKSWKCLLLFTACAAVPALAIDITPIQCPANCPDLAQLLILLNNPAPGDQYNPHISGNLAVYQNGFSEIDYYFVLHRSNHSSSESSRDLLGA